MRAILTILSLYVLSGCAFLINERSYESNVKVAVLDTDNFKITLRMNGVKS